MVRFYFLLYNKPRFSRGDFYAAENATRKIFLRMRVDKLRLETKRRCPAADAHPHNGKRFVVRVGEKLTAVLDLERQVSKDAERTPLRLSHLRECA